MTSSSPGDSHCPCCVLNPSCHFPSFRRSPRCHPTIVTCHSKEFTFCQSVILLSLMSAAWPRSYDLLSLTFWGWKHPDAQCIPLPVKPEMLRRYVCVQIKLKVLLLARLNSTTDTSMKWLPYTEVRIWGKRWKWSLSFLPQLYLHVDVSFSNTEAIEASCTQMSWAVFLHMGQPKHPKYLSSLIQRLTQSLIIFISHKSL